MIQLITRLIPVKKPRFLLNMKTILVSRIYSCENDMLMNMNEEDSGSDKVGEGPEMEVDVDPLMRTATRKVVMWTLYIVDTADMVNTVYIVYSVVSCIMKGCSNFFKNF